MLIFHGLTTKETERAHIQRTTGADLEHFRHAYGARLFEYVGRELGHFFAISALHYLFFSGSQFACPLVCGWAGGVPRVAHRIFNVYIYIYVERDII